MSEWFLTSRKPTLFTKQTFSTGKDKKIMEGEGESTSSYMWEKAERGSGEESWDKLKKKIHHY